MQIVKVTTAKIAEHYQDFRPAFEHRLKDFTTNKLKVGDVKQLYFAYEGDEAIGFTAIYIDEKDQETGVTVVKQAYRNKNIGTSLLRRRYQDFPEVKSKVWDGNIPSRRICEKSELTKVDEEVFLNRKIFIYALED